MERFVSTIISFAPHIIIPAVYILLMTGEKGIIKNLDRKPIYTNKEKICYGLTIGILSAGVWFCGWYAAMNIFLVILNFIPGIAI